jgi:hypothetical protein
MNTTITQADIDAGIARAHELRSLAVFDALAALTRAFKISIKPSPMGAAVPA